jgi:hypothetical protein
MAKLIQEEQVRYYADFIKLLYHDDGTVSEYKRIAVDVTKWFDPSKVIPGKLIGIEYQEKEGFYDHEFAWFHYDTVGDKDDIIRSYGGVITKIEKVTSVIIRKDHEEVIFKNDLEVNASPHSY